MKPISFIPFAYICAAAVAACAPETEPTTSTTSAGGAGGVGGASGSGAGGGGSMPTILCVNAADGWCETMADNDTNRSNCVAVGTLADACPFDPVGCCHVDPNWQGEAHTTCWREDPDGEHAAACVDYGWVWEAAA